MKNQKKKKKMRKNELTRAKRKKKKRKEERTTEEQWRRKKSGKKKSQKLRLILTSGSLHVCLITKMLLEIEFWKLKMSITYNSKIKELRDKNKN